MVPSIGALMNLRTPGGAKGTAYGLDNSVNAAGRMVAPMLGAGIAVWFGLRGVFALAGLVYLGASLVALHIYRRSQRNPADFTQPVTGRSNRQLRIEELSGGRKSLNLPRSLPCV